LHLPLAIGFKNGALRLVAGIWTSIVNSYTHSGHASYLILSKISKKLRKHTFNRVYYGFVNTASINCETGGQRPSISYSGRNWELWKRALEGYYKVYINVEL